MPCATSWLIPTGKLALSNARRNYFRQRLCVGAATLALPMPRLAGYRRHPSANDCCYCIPLILRVRRMVSMGRLGTLAVNQRAPILSLDSVLKERARTLNLEVIDPMKAYTY